MARGIVLCDWKEDALTRQRHIDDVHVKPVDGKPLVLAPVGSVSGLVLAPDSQQDQDPSAAKDDASGVENLYSTTEGRQRFPEILQDAFGEKCVVGFDRYGRAIGALVPIEAVRILAGFDDKVADDIKQRVAKAAKSLLSRWPREAAICGLDKLDLDGSPDGAVATRSRGARRGKALAKVRGPAVKGAKRPRGRTAPTGA